MNSTQEISLRLLAMAFLLTLASSNLTAGPIVGAWYITNAGQAQSTAVLAILADGRFMFIEDGNPALDPNGEDGLEKGTYTWNALTGDFSTTTLINTNGEWGMCNVPTGSTACSFPLGATAEATSTTLTLSAPGEGSFPFPRLVDPASPIVGAWYLSNGPSIQDLTVVVFLPNGKFMIGIDPPATAYIELGDYAWDTLTGAFNATVNSSNAPPGSSFGLGSFTSAEILNGGLLLSSRSESRTLANSTVPEPGTFALLPVGLAGLLVGRRKRVVSSKRQLSR